MKARPLSILIASFVVQLVHHPSPVLADAMSEPFLVFRQAPMIEVSIPASGTATFFGHDELSTAAQLPVAAPFDVYSGTFLADDFAVKNSNPIVRVQWWGSYLDTVRQGDVSRFLISFERNVPADPTQPDSFSLPGDAILSQILHRGTTTGGPGLFSETFVHPGGDPHDEALYEYNAQLTLPFEPEADTVYWLKIVALDGFSTGPEDLGWGWHNRDYTYRDAVAPVDPDVVPGEHLVGSLSNQTPVWRFQDAAVSGNLFIRDLFLQVEVDQFDFSQESYVAPIDGPNEIGQFGKDLAFALYAVAGPLLLGDADNDGVVTADDLMAVHQHFGSVEPAPPTGMLLGDANDDGAVTSDDLLAVQQNFGNALGAAGAGVPEPGTFGLLVVMLATLKHRKRGT